MKRFSSIDFMRGVAILLMLFLHSISDYLDVDGLIGQINNIPFINVIALVVLPFLGGLAGLFLLVSAISNMISMQKQLMKGRSPGMLALRQVITGFIIYIFAALSESTIGYHGSIMGMARHLDLPLIINWDVTWTRWGNFEAIHTIAWCVIINGAIHGLISIKGLWKKPKIQMAIYAVLAIGVLVATKFVWVGISNAYDGFPWGKTTFWGNAQYMPHIFEDSFIVVVKGWFYGIWAAPMEPLFPYLTVSFIGSIVGIACAQPDKAMFKGFMKIMLLIAVSMFLVGAVGIIIMMIDIIPYSFDDATGIYQFISFHRHWFPDHPTYGDYFGNFNWIFQFFSVTGWGLMATLSLLYVVEFRGKGKKFADKTRWVRRFGFTAFTNYNMQYIYPFVAFIVPQAVFGLGPYGKTGWFGIFFQIAITLSLYTLIMKMWEKVNYRGSLEWFMGMVGYYLVPIKKPESLKVKPWYAKGDLAVEQAFYNAEWVNIVEETDEYHRAKRDSRISLIFAIAAFCVPLFIPFTAGWLFVALKARKTEGKNKQNTTALILCVIGTVLTVLFSVALFIFSPSTFGIYL